MQFNDLTSQWLTIKENAIPEILDLFENSQFILGPQVERFENSFSIFCNCEYGIGVSNGTDAIKIASKSIELGNCPRIFMPANTFVATWLAVKEAYPNSQITMIDIDKYGQIDTVKLEQGIKNYKDQGGEDCLIVAVHMYGCCDAIDETSRIANKYDKCILIEDASQAHGAKSKKGTLAGSVGELATFSLYPGKNLGAAGDAGIIVTNNKILAEKCKMLRNYGSKEKYIHEEIGFNNRLDSLQAIILYWKLKKLEPWNISRSHWASYIQSQLNNSEIDWMLSDNVNQVYHILPVLLKNYEKRNAFIEYLNDNKVPCGVHYPIPIHKMPFFNEPHEDLKRTEDYCNRMVSLPIHPFLKKVEIDNMMQVINNFKG